MSLTDKLKIGQTGKRAVLAGTLAGVLAVSGCSGCRDSKDNSQVSNATVSTEVYQRDKDKKSKNEREYTYEDFKKALGPERLEGTIAREWEKSEQIWSSDDKNDVYLRKLLVEIYTGRSIKELSLPEGYKRDYVSFNPDSIQKEKLKELKKKVPWKIEKKNGKYDEADKKMLYVLVKVDEAIHEAAAEWFAKILVDYAIKPMIEAEREKNK